MKNYFIIGISLFFFPTLPVTAQKYCKYKSKKIQPVAFNFYSDYYGISSQSSCMLKGKTAVETGGDIGEESSFNGLLRMGLVKDMEVRGMLNIKYFEKKTYYYGGIGLKYNPSFLPFVAITATGNWRQGNFKTQSELILTKMFYEAIKFNLTGGVDFVKFNESKGIYSFFTRLKGDDNALGIYFLVSNKNMLYEDIAHIGLIIAKKNVFESTIAYALDSGGKEYLHLGLALRGFSAKTF
ncbi:MAG: hypothetical protein MI922_18175 [Bacteroidales bacterium]|nr:hypothetical protein [Bacteroidales bacterium]